MKIIIAFLLIMWGLILSYKVGYVMGAKEYNTWFMEQSQEITLEELEEIIKEANKDAKKED